MLSYSVCKQVECLILLITYCVVGPLSPKSDWLLISPYNITFESNVKFMRIKEMITNLRVSKNFSWSELMESIENSRKNMHTDVTVWGVKGERPNWIPLSPIAITDQTVQ